MEGGKHGIVGWAKGKSVQVCGCVDKLEAEAVELWELRVFDEAIFSE